MPITKKELRAKTREALQSLRESGSLKERSLTAINAISEATFFKDAKKILTYKALSDELNIDKLENDFPEKEWLIPELEVLEKENTAKQTIPPKSFINRCFSVDLILVPGLAFDKQGYRLGRGGGYYDRLLSEIQKQNQNQLLQAETPSDKTVILNQETTTQLQLIIGIIPQELYLESIPYEEHDIRMDLVLSF